VRSEEEIKKACEIISKLGATLEAIGKPESARACYEIADWLAWVLGEE
jgi:hypothetical protein